MRKYFTKVINQTFKNRKTRIENRKKLYKEQLEKRGDAVDKSVKRRFNKDEHMYENDSDAAKATRRKTDDIARVPGQLYSKGVKCKKCSKRFSTREAFLQHMNFSNKDTFKRRYLPRVRYVEREGVHLLCTSQNCCYHTQDLASYDAHLARKHGLLIKKSNLPIYQTVISSKNISEMHACPRCASTFSRKDSLKRHLQGCVGLPALLCSICGQDYHEINDLLQHMDTDHNPPTNFRLLNQFKEKQADIDRKIMGATSHENMHEKKLRSYSSPFKTLTRFYSTLTNLDDVLENIDTFNDIKGHLKKEVLHHARIKYHLFMKVILSKPADESGGENGVRSSVIRNSIDFEIASGMNIDKNLRECYRNLWSRAEQLAVRGSG